MNHAPFASASHLSGWTARSSLHLLRRPLCLLLLSWELLLHHPPLTVTGWKIPLLEALGRLLHRIEICLRLHELLRRQSRLHSRHYLRRRPQLWRSPHLNARSLRHKLVLPHELLRCELLLGKLRRCQRLVRLLHHGYLLLRLTGPLLGD